MQSRIHQFFLLLIASSMIACTSIYEDDQEWPPACCPQIKKALPPGNAQKFVSDSIEINTNKDEIAPVQRPRANDAFDSPCYRESHAAEQSPLDGIRPASGWVGEHFTGNEAQKEYFTKNIESITFLDNKRGFVSLSHPPDSSFARYIHLNIDRPSGGTDIFEFSLMNENAFQFNKLVNYDSIINSPFWDSHPFAFDTIIAGNSFTVLLWASDRDAPYAKAIDLRGNVRPIGQTDIYYAFRVNGEWMRRGKLAGDISQPGSFEGSPFVYCICKHPLLLFSTNRHDKSPNFIERDMSEDFDIDSVRINIDYDRLMISQDGPVGSFRKSAEDAFSYEGYEQDSTINSNADERFPYVAYPIDDPDETYIYFSSNRNRAETPVWGSEDSVIVSRGGPGGYDIYRFPLEVGCQPPPSPPAEPRLVVHIINAETGEYAEGPTSVTLKRYGAEVGDAPSHENPAEFFLDPNKEYTVFGGSSYSPEAQDCGDIATKYFAPGSDTTSVSLTREKTDTISATIKPDKLKEYIGGPVVRTEDSIVRYIDGVKYTGTLATTESLISSSKLENEDLYYCQIRRHEAYVVKNQPVYFTKTQNFEFINNFEKVRNGNVRSQRTLNGGIYTYNMARAQTLNDTIYVAPWRDTLRCITLNAVVKDRCNPGETVPDACLRLERYNPQTRLYEDVTNKRRTIGRGGQATFNLLEDNIYRVLGGSDYEGKGDCPDRLFYVSASQYKNKGCPVWKTGEMEFDKAFCSSILSDKSEAIDINTNEFLEAGIYEIYDTVSLKIMNFKKPPCRYEFTEIQDSLHRKVPYFQTGFWEVNTTRNYQKHMNLLNRYRSIYTSPYSQDSPPPGDVSNWGPWHWGAKWIELHPKNSYWIKRPDRPERIVSYRKFAEKVDQNLEQMDEIITNNLLPLFKMLDSLDKCELCPENKFIIRLKAWSDYRCVTHGWYIGPSVDYWHAEYEPNMSGDIESIIKPRKVHIEQDDPLGCDNTNLSDLRAYHGFVELYNLIKDDATFKHYEKQGLVLLPNDMSIKSEDEFFEKFSKAKVIILTKGFQTAPPDTVDIPEYVHSSTKTTLYDLDTTRSVDVVVENVGYLDGKIYDDKCCDTTSQWYKFEGSALQQMAREYIRKLPSDVPGTYAMVFSPLDPGLASELRRRIDRTVKENARIESIPGRDDLMRVILGPFDSYEDAERVADKLSGIPESPLLKIIPWRE
ncbi:MAG: SPOR domain-containing protein [Candidatus Kapaibacterium sp.]